MMARAALVLLSGLGLSACSARSSLEGGSGGAGSTTQATGASVTGSSSTGTPLAACKQWKVREPVVALPTMALSARAPEMHLDGASGEIDLTLIEANEGSAGVLRAGRLTAFSTWPPDYAAGAGLAGNILDYVAGDGADGPVGLLQDGSTQLSLATKLSPQLESMFQQTPGNVPLFAAGVSGHWLYGGFQHVPPFDILDVGSYQSGSLEQVQKPTTCTTSRVLAAAVPAGNGFVAAFALPNSTIDGCGPNGAPSTMVTMFRYDVISEQAVGLSSTETDHVVFGEPIGNLAMSRTTDGAWVFMQADGSTSLTPPAVLASRIDQSAIIVPIGSTPVPIAPDGAATGAFGAASLGDGAALAWVSETSTGQVVSVRTIGADSSLGDIVSFPTEEVFLTGQIRVIASANQRSLVVAWEGAVTGTRIGLARLDCAL